ncbi:MAG: hypothetical protein ACYDD5_00515 [Sulfuricurvum sp.]
MHITKIEITLEQTHTVISKDRQYTTRDGHKVEIYATDKGGDRPVHGTVLEDNGIWKPWSWTAEGMSFIATHSHLYDLIEVWEPQIDELCWFWDDDMKYPNLRKFKGYNPVPYLYLADNGANSNKTAYRHCAKYNPHPNDTIKIS